MNPFSIPLFTHFLLQLPHFINGLDPAYVEMAKIFGGSIGWVGSLALFMWWRDKKKQLPIAQ
jgi:hypothetical protein